MCNKASLVLTEKEVFFSKTSDSHSKIILEHKLHEFGVRGANILKVEVTPPSRNYKLPFDQWRFEIDQDILPDWHDPIRDKERAFKALSEWVQYHFIREGTIDLSGIEDPSFVFFGSSRAKNMESGDCIFYDSSTLENQSGGYSSQYDSSTLKNQSGGKSDKHTLL